LTITGPFAQVRGPVFGFFGSPNYRSTEVCMLESNGRPPRARSSLPKKKTVQKATVQAWRKTTNYRQWRAAVIDRDNRTCQFCASRKNLTAHHIVAASVDAELRYEIRNGITLCRNCHKVLERAQEKLLLPRCCGSCPFVTIIDLTQAVRQSGDRREIRKFFDDSEE
jgi:5-methylcytosine-specific restriction endonuclease McrA